MKRPKLARCSVCHKWFPVEEMTWELVEDSIFPGFMHGYYFCFECGGEI